MSANATTMLLNCYLTILFALFPTAFPQYLKLDVDVLRFTRQKHVCGHGNQRHYRLQPKATAQAQRKWRHVRAHFRDQNGSRNPEGEALFVNMALDLTVKVHPVVLFQIVDAYERRNSDSVRVIGTLLGELSFGQINCLAGELCPIASRPRHSSRMVSGYRSYFERSDTLIS